MDAFLNPGERESFKQMYQLFEQSTVNGSLQEFAQATRNKCFGQTDQVSMSDFHDLMFESRHLIFQVDQMRKSFIEYVQLPKPPKQSLLSRKTNQQEAVISYQEGVISKEPSLQSYREPSVVSYRETQDEYLQR